MNENYAIRGIALYIIATKQTLFPNDATNISDGTSQLFVTPIQSTETFGNISGSRVILRNVPL